MGIITSDFKKAIKGQNYLSLTEFIFTIFNHGKKGFECKCPDLLLTLVKSKILPAAEVFLSHSASLPIKIRVTSCLNSSFRVHHTMFYTAKTNPK